jgi:hypothetical protein
VLQAGTIDDEDPTEVAAQLLKWEGPYLVNAPCTPEFVAALAKIGKPYISEYEEMYGRVFLASEPPEGVEFLDKAKWTAKYINSLPDSAFLYIEAGGEKDADGKTVPRSLRHFPVYDANGKLDLPHLKNALSRIPQSNLPDDVKAKIKAKAETLFASTKAAKVEKDPEPAPPPEVIKTEKGKHLGYPVRFLKAETAGDERIVYGVVLEPETVDSQGDIYSAEEIKKACYLFMEQFGHFKIQHKGEFVDGALTTLENSIVPVDYETVDATGEPVLIKKGTWMHGARVNDDDVWEATKAGGFTGWSIGGWSKFTNP